MPIIILLQHKGFDEGFTAEYIVCRLKFIGQNFSFMKFVLVNCCYLAMQYMQYNINFNIQYSAVEHIIDKIETE